MAAPPASRPKHKCTKAYLSVRLMQSLRLYWVDHAHKTSIVLRDSEL